MGSRMDVKFSLPVTTNLADAKSWKVQKCCAVDVVWRCVAANADCCNIGIALGRASGGKAWPVKCDFSSIFTLLGLHVHTASNRE